MRALVTGGNRYIGLHLLHELVARGHDVTSSTATRRTSRPRSAGHCEPPCAGARPPRSSSVRDEFDIVYDNTAYDVADLHPMVELFTGRIQHFVFARAGTAVSMPRSDPRAADREPAKASAAGNRSSPSARCPRVAHTSVYIARRSSAAGLSW